MQNNSNCQGTSGYINYVEVLYCHFGRDAGTKSAALILYAVWLAYMLVGLGKAADDYLCPNLAVLLKTFWLLICLM